MPINTAPPPATCKAAVDPEGRGTVLQVTFTHNLDGETLALHLYEAYLPSVIDGGTLPDEVTAETVMQLLASERASCTEGWHTRVNEPTREDWVVTWPWAQRQSRRLFPNLTWNVEEGDREIEWPWEDQA
ncbi:hypothetical protein ABT224_20080 [Streptomyces sp. NPDC001584]|uniref:hypothetical protein n=1 Tax=Streptomyces sp. NPDC001584 TaxID=3154521 RepID=UPI003322381A